VRIRDVVPSSDIGSFCDYKTTAIYRFHIVATNNAVRSCLTFATIQDASENDFYTTCWFNHTDSSRQTQKLTCPTIRLYNIYRQRCDRYYQFADKMDPFNVTTWTAKNNARCMQARKTTHGLDRQRQDVDRTLCGRVNQNDRG